MKLNISPQTARKLKTTKIPESKINYESYKEIDEKFNDYCKESKKQLEDEILEESKIIQRPLAKSLAKEINLNKSQSFLNNFPRKESLKQTIKEYYKKNNENKEQKSPELIMNHCSNLLINSFFQALAVHTIQEINTRKENNENENNISSKFLKSVGIDPIKLKSIENKSEKNKYIINTMNNTIDKMLSSWKEKIEQREKQLESYKQVEITEIDSFNWINLRTKYNALKKKLTNTVVQKLNDYENQIKIVQTLNQRKRKRDSAQVISSNELKVTLDSSQHFKLTPIKPFTKIKIRPLSRDSISSTTSLKKNAKSDFLNKSDKKIIFKHKNPALRKIQKDQFNDFLNDRKISKSRNMSTIFTSEIVDNSLKNELSMSKISPRNKTKFNNDKEKLFKVEQNKFNLNNFLSENVDKQIEINEKILNRSLVWEPSLENEFQFAKKRCKSIFFDEMKGTNWNCIGTRNLIQLLFKENRKNVKRQEKMTRYAEGDWLTAEEIKFLADTSELLNSCVDRRYLQNAVNIIDEDNFHYMELNLAEQIIRKYDEMKAIITKARLEYYKNYNKETLMKLNFYDFKEYDKERKKAHSLHDNRYKKMVTTILKLVENKNKKMQDKEDEEIIEELLAKNFSAKFKKDLSIADLIRKKEAKNMKIKLLKQNKKPPQYQKLINEDNNPLVVKHTFHPSSKLYKLDPEDKEIKGREFAKFLSNQEEEFKISIKCPATIRVPKNFAKYYSGGPGKKHIMGLNAFDEEKETFRDPTQEELSAIIRIQSRLRGMIERRRYKLLHDELMNKKYVEAQQRIYNKHYQKLQNENSNSPLSPNYKSQANKYLIKALANNNPHSSQSLFSMQNISQNQLESNREEKIRNKIPKNLLLKHRKLLEAAVKNNFYMVNNSGFIYYPNDIDVRDRNFNSALFYTAKNENIEFCQFLLNHKATVNLKCENGNTPFHMAFASNNLIIIMLFIENQGDLNCINDQGQTPLAFCNKYTLKTLDLEKGIVSVNPRNAENLNFDNNKLLFKYKGYEIKFPNRTDFKFNNISDYTNEIRTNNSELCCFNKEKKKTDMSILSSPIQN